MVSRCNCVESGFNFTSFVFIHWAKRCTELDNFLVIDALWIMSLWKQTFMQQFSLRHKENMHLSILDCGVSWLKKSVNSPFLFALCFFFPIPGTIRYQVIRWSSFMKNHTPLSNLGFSKSPNFLSAYLLCYKVRRDAYWYTQWWVKFDLFSGWTKVRTYA